MQRFVAGYILYFCYMVMLAGCITLLAKVCRRDVASTGHDSKKLRVQKLPMTSPRRHWPVPETWASGGAGGNRKADVASEVAR